MDSRLGHPLRGNTCCVTDERAMESWASAAASFRSSGSFLPHAIATPPPSQARGTALPSSANSPHPTDTPGPVECSMLLPPQGTSLPVAEVKPRRHTRGVSPALPLSRWTREARKIRWRSEASHYLTVPWPTCNSHTLPPYATCAERSRTRHPLIHCSPHLKHQHGHSLSKPYRDGRDLGRLLRRSHHRRRISHAVYRQSRGRWPRSQWATEPAYPWPLVAATNGPVARPPGWCRHSRWDVEAWWDAVFAWLSEVMAVPALTMPRFSPSSGTIAWCARRCSRSSTSPACTPSGWRRRTPLQSPAGVRESGGR